MTCCTDILKKDNFKAFSKKDFKHGEFNFTTFTLNFLTALTKEELVSKVTILLQKNQAYPVLMIISGGTGLKTDQILNRMPTIWIKGDKCDDEFVTSIQLITSDAEPIYATNENDRCVSASLADSFGEYCWFGNVIASDLTKGREEQSADAFDNFNIYLNQVGMNFTHVGRTWLYLDQLLDWYDEFNVVRNDFFNKEDIFNHLVPASTGIGASNADGAEIIMGGFASKPKGETPVIVAPVNSPLQCPAWDYKSSFSRAISITTGNDVQIMVSGTASIEPGGKTVHLDEIEPQIDLTMKVIAAMLAEVNMTFAHVTRATAYCKETSYLPVMNAWLAKNGYSDMALAFSHADVCRHDLLFEVELDAAVSK